MIINILNALAGDCFVVDFENNHCILIDGGYIETYEYHLKSLLRNLGSKGCQLDYVILTHYDEDHILGLKRFIKDNGKEQRIIKVGSIIVNGYSSFCSVFSENEVEQIPLLNTHPYFTESSAEQNCEFELLCLQNGYRINTFTNGKPILQGCSTDGEDYKLYFISPNHAQLENYKTNIINYLESNNYIVNAINFQNLVMNLQTEENDRIEELLPSSGQAVSDIEHWKNMGFSKTLTMPNQASLAFEIINRDRKVLFCGDADMNCHKKSLQKRYDLIKLSHHGTVRGNECFFGDNPILSEHYIISTDGKNRKNKHPSHKLLAEVITQNIGKDTPIHLHFNNDICHEVIDRDYSLLTDNKQKQKYNYKLYLQQNIIKL